MGWRGTMRSVGAIMRAAERDAARHRKAVLKDRISTDSADAVSALDEYLERLVTVHVDLQKAIDWTKMAGGTRPTEPEPGYRHQEKVATALTKFRPSILDLFRGGWRKRKQRLRLEYPKAQERDDLEFSDRQERYQQELAEWEDDQRLATGLLRGESQALREVIAEMHSFTSESRIGTSISFEIDDRFVHAKPVVHDDKIIPRLRRKQLASGRLSESAMPAGQFNELYQDYVASVALRVAGDLLQMTPIEEIYVTCLATLLDQKTGHMHDTPILSVHVVRETFSRLNLSQIDPSDALSNFRHHMKFKRTVGFDRVDPIVPFRIT